MAASASKGASEEEHWVWGFTSFFLNEQYQKVICDLPSYAEILNSKHLEMDYIQSWREREKENAWKPSNIFSDN